ncbi:putative autophagy-related protein 11 [Octopus bimaculoides]|uniref:DUF4515 domain-containing protein n=1 Tax=Octopus bimaculoides TaxID=37653 RepID=A0A0L8G627_OCTBM|nr:putative autophagy-related protein 11 [Octopus bimaculoides]|eukprot:XP_014784061.1 PREDICTED: uncharacterized protein PFB0765w-like [Octopus bimaculoides]
MPPKKKKQKKKTNSPKETVLVPEKTLKETILEKHLQDITRQLEKCKARVAELQYENTSLEDEATKTRTESHEYMNYMGKKTELRQKTVVTLNDHNKELFRAIQEERKQIEEKYDGRKKDLETVLLAKRHVLHQTKKEMDALQESKFLQEEQLKRITELEKEIIEIRNHHALSVEELKEKYIDEKMKFRMEADEKIRVLTKEANEEARKHLVQYAEMIKNENRSLRRQLKSLIVSNRALLDHRQRLEEQHKTLAWKLQYAEDMKSLHRRRLNKASYLNNDSTSILDDLVNSKSIALKKLYAETNP